MPTESQLNSILGSTEHLPIETKANKVVLIKSMNLTCGIKRNKILRLKPKVTSVEYVYAFISFHQICFRKAY